MTQQEIDEGTIQMRIGERKMLRENERWTEDDRKTLRREYFLGTPINEIALMLERSEGAIYQQIKQQGMCVQNHSSKKKSSKKKEFDDYPEVLSVEETCEMLCIGRNNLYDL